MVGTELALRPERRPKARKPPKAPQARTRRWSRGKQRSTAGPARWVGHPMPARDRYPINAEELARQLRVNAKSLRALLRAPARPRAGACQARGISNLPGSREGDLASSRRASAAEALEPLSYAASGTACALV